MTDILTIGLIGYGTAGKGFHQILEKSYVPYAKVKTIVVRDKDKPRENSSGRISYESGDVLDDNEINTVVELINDSTEAWEIVSAAIKAGKNIVTGNKKMVAENITEIISLQKQHNVSVLYDASVCASIPIIRSMEEYYDKDLLTSIRGILNGSVNFILTKIFDENVSYELALKEAQEKGFAESNPHFDVAGFDTLYKLVVLTTHSFRVITNPNDIFRFGIENIQNSDIEFARINGYKIKLTGNSIKTDENKVALYVIPTLVKANNPLYSVNYEYNAVSIDGIGYDNQLMIGKGAGSFPTGSAVFSDISALNRKYRYHLNGANGKTSLTKSDNHTIKLYLRSSNFADIFLFNFKTLLTEENSEGNYIVTGEITIGHLRSIAEIIESKDIFIAEIL